MSDYASQLDRIDWNFPQAGTVAGSIHKTHWFAGNFIPQIPAALIEILSEPGDVTLDPFGGSGTTLIEAARLGRRTIYSDAVSACYFIAKRKLAAATSGLTPKVRSEVMAMLTWAHECETVERGENGEGSNPALELWYEGRTLAQLRYL